MNETKEQDQPFEAPAIFNSTFYSQGIVGCLLDYGGVFLLFVIMMSFGCTLKFSELKKLILIPKEIGIAICIQYGLMPLLAFSLGHAFQLQSIESLVILLCGCCPGGKISNILTLTVQGDMNLSILMTVCSTFLALGMMPFLLYIYCLGLNLGPIHKHVPFEKISIFLLLTVVPCCAGMVLNNKKPRYAQCFIKLGKILGLILVVGLLILSGLYVKSDIIKIFSPWLIGAAVLMPFTGYMLGYGLAALFRLCGPSRRAICMETGCQNAQLCSVILKFAFESEVIGPYVLFPFLYVLFQVLLGLSFVFGFRIYDKLKASDMKHCSVNNAEKDENMNASDTRSLIK